MTAEPYQAARAHIVRRGQVLLGWNADRSLWTTFGGKTELGETPEETLVRELREELGIRPTSLNRLDDRTRGWDGGAARIAVFAVSDWDGELANLAPREHATIGWFDAGQVAFLAMTEEARREALWLLSTAAG